MNRCKPACWDRGGWSRARFSARSTPASSSSRSASSSRSNAKTIVDAAGLAETAAVLAYTAIGLISAFLLARAVVTLRRDGQSATATA
jgi:hypothetical protein